MKNSVVLLAVLFFSIKSGYCQKNYQSGYVIELSGDTLKGLIDYRNWVENPKIVSFKKNSGSEAKSYSPQDCKAFVVADEIYVSALLPVELDSDIRKATPSMVISSVFLQTCISGKKSLYYYRGNRGKSKCFYIFKDSNYQYLEYKKYIVDVNEQTKSAENKKFVGQLAGYFQDCQVPINTFSGVKYSLGSLEKAFDQYYICSQLKPSFQKRMEKTVLQFGVASGLSITKLKFSSSEPGFDYLTKASFSQPCNISGGFFLEAIFGRNNHRWSMNSELLFSSYLVEGDYYYHEVADFYEHTEIGNSMIRLNTMARFRYPIHKFSIYVNGGVGYGFSIDQTNKRVTTKTFVTTVTTDEGEALPDFKKLEVDLILGIGCKYQRYSFEMRNQSTFSGLTSVIELGSSASTNWFLLSYRF